MTPVWFLVTTVLMGFFVLAGGCWGLLYCLGKTRHSKRLLQASACTYLVALSLGLVIGLLTPLELKWRVLIIASGIAYAFIPPITLKYLDKLEGEEAQQ